MSAHGHRRFGVELVRDEAEEDRRDRHQDEEPEEVVPRVHVRVAFGHRCGDEVAAEHSCPEDRRQRRLKVGGCQRRDRLDCGYDDAQFCHRHEEDCEDFPDHVDPAVRREPAADRHDEQAHDDQHVAERDLLAGGDRPDPVLVHPVPDRAGDQREQDDEERVECLDVLERHPMQLGVVPGEEHPGRVQLVVGQPERDEEDEYAQQVDHHLASAGSLGLGHDRLDLSFRRVVFAPRGEDGERDPHDDDRAGESHGVAPLVPHQW